MPLGRLLALIVASVVLGGGPATAQVEEDTPNDNRRLFSGDLVKELVSHPRAKCADGTGATLYLRRNPDSGLWIVVLPGGESCNDRATCGVYLNPHALPRGCGSYDPTPGTPDCTEPQPAIRAKALVSSACDAATRRGAGLLSPDRKINPHFYDANAVWLRYCSSDYWIGRAPASPRTEGIHFTGHINLFASLEDLVELHGMKRAAAVIVVGNAASGALGLIWQGDRIADFLGRRIPGIKVWLVADSAWMLNQDPFPSFAGECLHTDPVSCPLATSLRRAIETYQPDLPEGCEGLQHPWQCLIAEYRVPMLETPIFHAQYLYDIGQLGMSTFPDPLTATDRDWLWARDAVARSFRKLLSEQDGAFAVSCYQHGFLTVDAWRQVKVESNGEEIDVSEALHRWLQGRSARFVDECEGRNCNTTCSPCTLPPDPT